MISLLKPQSALATLIAMKGHCAENKANIFFDLNTCPQCPIATQNLHGDIVGKKTTLTQKRFDLVFKKLLGLHANDFFFQLTVFKQQKRGNTAYVVIYRHFRVVVYV